MAAILNGGSLKLNKLWAPWRIKYLTQNKIRGCIFCRAGKAGKSKNEQNFVVERSPHSFIILNAFPYNNGHLMAVPRRHVDALDKLNDGEILDLYKSTLRAIRLLQKTLKPDGFNVGMNLGKIAGAGIEKHIHIHIVPRWQGDTNFMPVLADTKIISQSLHDLYKLLTKAKTLTVE